MNKTVSISLSGQVFQIDELAYDRLKLYLENIRARFSSAEGGQEIIADIEARIAEVFNEKLNDRKQVITIADVDDMIAHMGKPEDFDAMGEQEGQSAGERRAMRRLFRDPDDKVVAGICSGASAYLGIEDPLWFRLAFVLAVIFSFGSPILIYIILWLIVPEAKTASEKLQMRGERINISNIEKTIKDDLNDLKDRISNIDAKEGTKKAGNFFSSLIELVIGICVFAIKFVFKIAAILIILLGLVIIISLAVAVTFPAYVDGFSIASLHPLFFGSQTIVFLGLLGIVLVIGIPALVLTMLGFHMLMGRRRRVKGLGVSLFGMWLIGLGLVLFTGLKTGSDFRAEDTVRTEIPIAQPSSDTFFLDSSMEPLPDGKEGVEFFNEGYFTSVDSAYHVTGRIKFDIVKSLTGDFQLLQEANSHGRNRANALGRAEAVAYNISQEDSVLRFAQHFAFPMDHHFRGQKIQLTLKVPEGKAVFISRGVGDIIYDIKNVTDTYDGDMIGHTWAMMPAGLTCLDCDFTVREGDDSGFPAGKVSREFDFSDFSRIVAEGAFNIEIRQGSEYRISTDGNQRFADNIEVSRSGERLKIDTGSKPRMFHREGRGTVRVTMPALTSLEISGANHAVVSGFEGDDLRLEASGASEVDMKSSFRQLSVEASGASSVTLSGAGTGLDAAVNGASRLKAFGYEAENCNIKVNGASKAEMNVSKELNAEANGASEILYKGLPKISSDVTGFSSMKPSK